MGIGREKSITASRDLEKVYEIFNGETNHFQNAISDMLFPYTDRSVQLLFADLKRQISTTKEVTPKTL